MMINVNDTVRVKLNDHGRDILRKNWDALGMGKSYPLTINEDANGYYRTQLWCLMEEFGPHIRMGCKMPFDANIEICV